MRGLATVLLFVSLLGTVGCGDVFCTDAPVVTGISPDAAPAGSPDLPITISGRHFHTASTVWWNEVQVTNLQVLTDTQIAIIVPAEWLASAGRVTVKVVTLPLDQNMCGGGSSEFVFIVS